MTASRLVGPNAVVEFRDSSNRRHVHELAELSGWSHFSVRVHQSFACQADCVVTANEIYNPKELLTGGANGIRFQPFFLPGSTSDTSLLRGQGLFRRGLHFSGTVTPGSVRLSCECDVCNRSFQVQSFHAGFSDMGYMYSGSGAYTLLMDAQLPGAPPPTGTPDTKALESLEAVLPPAPDGTVFRYLNPFRCPHCHEPYIDFEAHPEIRSGEYYGNYLFGTETLRYPPKERSLDSPQPVFYAETAEIPPPLSSLLKRLFRRG